MNQQYLALELFHILHVNHLHFDYQHCSWMGDIPHSLAQDKVEDKLILYSASLILSGITKQRIDTKLTKLLISQIQTWSRISKGRYFKTFNPDLNAVRFVPACLQSH